MSKQTKNTRIYGIDPGNLDTKRIKNAPDWKLFLVYHSLTLAASQMNSNDRRRHSHGCISDQGWKAIEKELTEIEYSIEYLLYAISKKIGIEVSEPATDKRISPNLCMFIRWHTFHYDHFRTFSNEQLAEFNAKRKNGEDISKYLPLGNWREHTQA